MGTGVFIGTDAILETAYPDRVRIGNGVVIGHRALLIAHFRESGRLHDEGEPAVVIEDDAFIGPNVTIGLGAVVAAGSVVSQSVPPLTMVQGVPARPVARCGVALGMRTPLKEFYRQLRPIRPASKTHNGPRSAAPRESSG